MQDSQNEDALNDLKEIRRKQYEATMLLRQRKSSKVKKEEIVKDQNQTTPTEIEKEKEEPVQPLFSVVPPRQPSSSQPSKTEKEEGKGVSSSTDNTQEPLLENADAKPDLANERRKNKGFESKDSKLLHYLFILYYKIKTIFTFIYMFFHSLISPQAATKYANRNKPKKYSSFDTYQKDNQTFDARYLGYGQCCSSCG